MKALTLIDCQNIEMDTSFIKIGYQTITTKEEQAIIFPIEICFDRLSFVSKGKIIINNVKEILPFKVSSKIQLNLINTSYLVGTVGMCTITAIHRYENYIEIEFIHDRLPTYESTLISGDYSNISLKNLIKTLGAVTIDNENNYTDFTLASLKFNNQNRFKYFQLFVSLLEYLNNCKCYLYGSTLYKITAPLSIVEKINFTDIEIKEEFSTFINKVTIFRAQQSNLKNTELVLTKTDNISYYKYNMIVEKKITFPFYIDTTTANKLADLILSIYAKPNLLIKIKNVVFTHRYSSFSEELYSLPKLNIAFYQKENRIIKHFYSLSDNTLDLSNFSGGKGAYGINDTYDGFANCIALSFNNVNKGYITYTLEEPKNYSELVLIYRGYNTVNNNEPFIITIEGYDQWNNSLGTFSVKHTKYRNDTSENFRDYIAYQPNYLIDSSPKTFALDNDYSLALDNNYALMLLAHNFQVLSKIKITFEATSSSYATIQLLGLEAKYNDLNIIEAYPQTIDLKYYRYHSVMDITANTVNKEMVDIFENIITSLDEIKRLLTN